MAKKSTTTAPPTVSTQVGGSSGDAIRRDEGAEGSLATDPLPTTRVNKANLGEIKSAIDDIVKKQLQAQSFTPSILHPTVHLSLGYTSVILALGSCLYSWHLSFDESKPALWIGVIGYFVLQGALWAWKRWVEAGEVFSGKRRRMVKRIETDIVHIISSTSLAAPSVPSITHSPHTRPVSPTSSPSSPSSPSASSLSLSPSASSNSLREAHSASASMSAKSSGSSTGSSTYAPNSSGPTYSLHLSLSTTSNNGKSLIHKSRVVAGRGVGEFVDVNGGVEEGEVGRWLSRLLVDAGLVGAEEEGVKEE